MELRAPFRDIDIIRSGMKISPTFKLYVDGQLDKYLHRKLAEHLGLPKEVCWEDRLPPTEKPSLHECIRSLADDLGYDSLKRSEKGSDSERVGNVYRYLDKKLIKDTYTDLTVEAYLDDISKSWPEIRDHIK